MTVTGKRAAAGLLVALVATDRWWWARSQIWAIDDAFHIRLAETLPWRVPPVGILNTVFDPNPNGLIWLAWLVSPLPSFLAISFVLALAQALAAYAMVRAALPPKGRLPVLLTLLASVHLRAVSPALWSPWLFTALNMVALAALFACIAKPASPKTHPMLFAVSLVCALAAPSFYLPGVINAICMAVLWAIVLRHHPPSELARLGVVAIILVVAAGILCFGPFVAHVDVFALQSMAERSLPKRVALSGLEAVTSPLSALRFAFGDVDLFAQPPGPEYGTLRLFLRAAGVVLMIQAVVCVAAVAWAVRRLPAGFSRSPAPLVLGAAFIVLAHVVNTLVTAGAWYRDGEAAIPQQLIQFWPVVLLLVFGAPFVVADDTRFARGAQRITYAFAVLFALANVAAGERLLTGILDPDQGIVQRLGPPSPSLQQSVDWVVQDWRARGPSTRGALPVEFIAQHVSVDWTDAFVPAHDKWHERQLKVGEAFDLVLERRHALRNACGRRCPAAWPKYVVSVTGDARPPGTEAATPLWQDPWLQIWWVDPPPR